MARRTDKRADPRAIWAQAEALEAQAVQLRQNALAAALEEAKGFELVAAEKLGVSRDSLRAMVRKRFPALGEMAAKLRAKAGYGGKGQPHKSPAS